MEDLKRSCVHTITTKPWPIETAVEKYAAAGIAGITVWRDALEGRSLPAVRKRIADAGLALVSTCRGGFFASTDADIRTARIAENLRAVDEAAELGAPHLVLVCGADPKQSLETSRAQIGEGIAAVLPRARERGVKLAVEPLHPMYADTRSAIVSLAQANDLVEGIGDPSLGIAVDVYHLWWDPALQEQIARAGRSGAILAFHVCDWNTPTADLLNDRALMGDGCIDLKRIRGWVEETGWRGFVETEIFSTLWWSRDQDGFLAEIRKRYLTSV